MRLARLFAVAHHFGTAYGIYCATLREQTHFVRSHSPKHKKNTLNGRFLMARLARFELTTLAFGGQYSIQLSYKRIWDEHTYTLFLGKMQGKSKSGLSLVS